jgi:multiple antibiotic resistance protein
MNPAMQAAIGFAVLSFTSLLAIVNPLGAVPMYLAMTGHYEARQRRSTLRRAILTAVCVLFAFALLGTWILQFFGITTHAFQIAGGIIFFGIGWDMLQARRSRVKTTEQEETESISQDDVGIIPLGLPTLAGPGAITTVIALQGQAVTLPETLSVYGAIILVLITAWIMLSAAPTVTRKMSQTAMNVMTRIMGLLVMVVGAQFVINGLTVVLVNVARQAGI